MKAPLIKLYFELVICQGMANIHKHWRTKKAEIASKMRFFLHLSLDKLLFVFIILIVEEESKVILLIEPDKTVRKKLCDLLSRERIIGIDSISQTLEMVCKYKAEVDVIIAGIRLLREIISHRAIFRLCEKLRFDTPPLLGFYRNGDERTVKEFQRNNKQYKLVRYNEADSSFPDQYIQMIKEVYPGLNADLTRSREVWSKEIEEFVDPRKWLEEEGFLDIGEKPKKRIIAGKQRKVGKAVIGVDYKKLYFEYKKKYDELLEYVKELTDAVEEA